MNILQLRYDIRIAKHVLLVVDMQPVWATSNNPELQERIAMLINWSMHHGCPIIFLEYRHSDNEPTERTTHECLLKLVRDYDLYSRVPKRQSRGSDETVLRCIEAGYPTNNFIVAGVDADACVINTVTGLARMRPNARIQVVRDACRASNEITNNDESFWKRFVFKNVSLCHLQESAPSSPANL